MFLQGSETACRYSQISDSESAWQPYLWKPGPGSFQAKCIQHGGSGTRGNASNLSFSGLIHSQKRSSNIESPFLLAGAQGREGAQQTIPEVSGKTVHSFPPPLFEHQLSCWGLKNQKQILHVHGCQAWVPQPPRPEDHARKCGPLRHGRISSDQIPAAPEGFKRSLIFETSGHWATMTTMSHRSDDDCGHFWRTQRGLAERRGRFVLNQSSRT